LRGKRREFRGSHVRMSPIASLGGGYLSPREEGGEVEGENCKGTPPGVGTWK